MAEIEATIGLFAQEIDEALADRHLVQQSPHMQVLCPPLSHEVNDLTYYRRIPQGHTGANLEEFDILARGVRFLVRDSQCQKRVSIETPMPDEPQDHLVRVVQFMGLTLGGSVRSQLVTPKELAPALTVATKPHRSRPARLALATLSEAELDVYRDKAEISRRFNDDQRPHLEGLWRGSGLIPPRGDSPRYG